MAKIITESEVEEVALDVLKGVGYSILYGPDIAPAPEGSAPERESFSDVVLVRRLRDAIDKLNPDLPRDAKDEALKRVMRHDSPKLIVDNDKFHSLLVNGVDVEYRRKDGKVVGGKVILFDFERPQNNDFVAVNQFTIIEDRHNRRPDIILFVNGLPLVVVELKNPADENATVDSARAQFETYKIEIPSLFRYNSILIASDGNEAVAGTITSDKERFTAWKTVDGKKIVAETIAQLPVLLKGMCAPTVLLDLVRHFIVFEKDKSTISKKIAAYHQYYAVNKAIDATLKAAGPRGDKRCGVIWHTQGSGKSLVMAFYAGKLILAPKMENPTLVVLTDRNDLDGQLFDNFSKCASVLRQDPVQADSRSKLKELLKVSSGGIVFTTIQKFFPEQKDEKYPILSDRRNIIVIADEAHRSQYDFIDGFAKHMRDALPNASFIGFTGTPIERADRSTPAVFGDYIDIYDVLQAIDDKVTVKITYESRLAKLELNEKEKPKLDPSFEEVTEGEEVLKKEKLKTRWARLEAIVGSPKRIRRIAKDIVSHFEQRLDVLDGKAMVVGMSRRICVELYNEIVKLRPAWASNDDNKGFIKVIMTGSASDPVSWQQHIRNKPRRYALGDRFKDCSDPLKIVIVRDMWLTGFDVPCLHTMYMDKPMRGHGLMQAIARVNRVFKDKPGGLIVDYLGIADELRQAVNDYTASGGRGKPADYQDDAVALMLEKYEILQGMYAGFNYKRIFTAKTAEKLNILRAAQQHILGQKDGKERYLQHVTELSRSFALAVPHEEALAIRDDVGFFQAVRSLLAKFAAGIGKSDEELDSAIKQIVSKALVSDQVIDVFAAAGLKKPDVSILSDEFLAEVKDLPHKNLALELLKKLLNDEIRTRQRTNLVQGRSFALLLESAIRKYQNRSIETAQIIDELINLAKQIREIDRRRENLGLSEPELAFYDALVTNDSAVQVLGDEKLRVIARELLRIIKDNVSIDWTLRENVQANLRVLVKRILKKYGYPPDKQQAATDSVLEQAKLVARDWAELEA